MKNEAPWEYLDEVKLARVYQHATGDRPIAIVTAFRDGSNEKKLPENRANNKKLAEMIRQAGYGYFLVRGHWIENEGKEDERKVIEESIFVVGPVEKEGEKTESNALRKHLLRWVIKYDQDGAIFRPANDSNAYIISKSGTMTKIGQFKPNKIGVAYSDMKTGKKGEKRTFVFETAWRDKTIVGRHLEMLEKKGVKSVTWEEIRDKI